MCIQNPIPMDIPVELPQVKVKVLHAKDQDSEIDCTDEESAPAMCREEDKDSNVSFSKAVAFTLPLYTILYVSINYASKRFLRNLSDTMTLAFKRLRMTLAGDRAKQNLNEVQFGYYRHTQNIQDKLHLC